MENVDKKNVGLPSRYINALYELCDETKKLKKVTQDFEKFISLSKENNDFRGSFSELTRAFSQGQTSFSVTKKGVVRGNHFHTRKIERFSVIKGKAKIKLREILSNEKLEFILDGVKPCYIDIPVWYTHNIENIGDEDLITVFWINEHYNDETSDTYIENV